MIKPGMLISDRYEIIEKVGSGGMADVYKAKCHRLNRFVAIKVLKQEFSNDRSFVNKFRGEAQSAAGLSHPNIVNVYDVGDEDGLYYIVMELVEGITLKKFIERKGKLEVKEAIGISIQIAQGMEAAHANHIIHRDIKPQNIIISKEGKVKVTDFGIAKATTSNTITSNAMGSVHYLSPEQARGGYSDEKSDIYSLGVTMYEMLSGQVPFAGENNVSVALAHIQGEAKPLHEVNPDTPHGVDMIVQKCMQKKPERRYLTASELITDLKKAISNPNGDFVKLVAPIVSDSPTISLTDDDLRNIKSSAGISNMDTDYGRKPVTQVEENTDDDDDIDSVDPRVTKLLIGFGIPVVLIIIILVVWLVTKLVSSVGAPAPSGPIATESVDPFNTTESPAPSVNPEDEFVTMISVTGQSEEDAKTALLAISSEFEITVVNGESSEYKAGEVIEQTPSADSKIAKNSKIVLTVKAAAQEFTLQDYKGWSYAEVEKALQALNLKVSKSEVYDNNVAEGKVIATIPAAGSSVAEGEEIVVNVSKGAETCTVPNLIGKLEKEAKELIANAGLTVGEVTPTSSDKYEAGQVTYQSYSAGESVKSGTKIDISVSTGPEKKDEPSQEPTKEPTKEPMKEPTKAPTPTPEEEDVEYVSSITLKSIPFPSGKTSGFVVLNLEQNGQNSAIYQNELSEDDLPITIPITSDSDANGTVTIYIDGVLIQDASWQVNFVKK